MTCKKHVIQNMHVVKLYHVLLTAMITLWS